MKKMSKTTITSGKQSIVFFGSGPVAAASLRLLAENFIIESVITKPKPDHHRGEFPVLELADALGLSVLTVRNKAELSSLFATMPVSSTVAVLIDFGIIISQDVIDYFPLGIVNSHFSLLPEWRGADPITFSILSGQEETGVSLMLLVEKMDEGPLLAQAPYKLTPTITTPELTDDLVQLSYECLKQILPLYIEGKTEAAPQEEVTIAPSVEPTYSRKLSKQDGAIDWTKSAEQIEREIRAFIEWPKSITKLGPLDVVITAARVGEETNENPGTVSVKDKQLAVACAETLLYIESLKPAGKNEMPAEAFLAGYQKQILS